MSATESHRPPNHVLVDVENVKEIDTSLLENRNISFHLFLGPDNKSLKIEVVESLLLHAERVQIIRSPEKGNNALDFVLAYHLGQVSSAEPKAHFHIISKDKGFDSLVKLLNSRKIKAKRHSEWSTLNFQSEQLPAVQPVRSPVGNASKTLSVNSEKILGYLRKSEKNRPKKMITLLRQVQDYLGKEATSEMAGKVVEELRRGGRLSFDENLKPDYTKIG